MEPLGSGAIQQARSHQWMQETVHFSLRDILRAGEQDLEIIHCI